MRIVFMGTPEFSLPSLKILLDNSATIAAVVTVPDAQAGRGRHMVESPVKQFAVGHGLRCLQPEKLKDAAFQQQLRDVQPDLFVVVAFRILPPEVFMIPPKGAFNLHASLLPKYRGAAPINWAIIKGETETGVTTFFLKETVDTGNIILQARIPIREDDTAGTVHDRLSEVGAEIVLHTVRLIESGKANPVPQDASLASPAPKIFTEDCKIPWSSPARAVHNFIRGLSPRPGAWTTFSESSVKIFKAQVADRASGGSPGEILRADTKLVVAAGEGSVEVLELQQEGKKRLTAAEFLRGARIRGEEKFL
jgi:methionyl-tRNA formyltransferase